MSFKLDMIHLFDITSPPDNVRIEYVPDDMLDIHYCEWAKLPDGHPWEYYKGFPVRVVLSGLDDDQVGSDAFCEGLLPEDAARIMDQYNRGETRFEVKPGAFYDTDVYLQIAEPVAHPALCFINHMEIDGSTVPEDIDDYMTQIGCGPEFVWEWSGNHNCLVQLKSMPDADNKYLQLYMRYHDEVQV